MINPVGYKILKIGKSSSNDVYSIFYNDPTVSKIHCEIFIDDSGNKFLTDLNSTNGTFVNGNKINSSVRLEKNDILKLGNTIFNWQAYPYDSDSKIGSFTHDSNANKPSGNLINDTDYKYERNNLVSRNKYLWLLLILIPIIFIISNNDSNEKITSVESTEPIDNPTIIDENIVPISFPTPRPVNGFSPYNNYYGSGIYHNSTDNTIKVTAPLSKDIVIMFKDIYSNRMIRNEYIRAGNIFSLTGIPFGKYKFFYIYGDDWSAEADFKGGLAKGNFLKDKGVSKSDKFFDVEFEDGYYGTYSLTLQLLSNGNLNTVEGSESDL